MTTNAAGEPLASSYAPAGPARPALNSIRFKLYFTSHPDTNNNMSGDEPTQHSIDARRQQYHHLMIPYRLPMSGVTLQDLAEEAVSRIGKRYPQLTAQYDMDSVDCIPLCWGSSSSSPRHTEGAAAAPSPSNKPNSNYATGGTNHHTEAPSWYFDTSAAYRLDIAMNGQDDVDYYFALPPSTPASSLVSVPPFELIAVWRSKLPPLTTQQRLTPTTPVRSPPHPATQQGLLYRPPSAEAVSSAGHSGKPSPTAMAYNQFTSRPPLPPVYQRSNTPQRLPALEPRKPSDGAARYHQTSTPPLIVDGDSPHMKQPQHHTARPPMHPVPPPAVSAEESELRAALRHSLPNSASDNSLEAFTRANISPNGQVGRVNSGRRSLTTFVELEGDGIPLGLGNARTSPNCETDSEVNMEETVGFQAQLIILTEGEDRDAIEMQESMEFTTLLRSVQTELKLLDARAQQQHNQQRSPQPPHSLISPTNQRRVPIAYDTTFKVAQPGAASAGHHNQPRPPAESPPPPPVVYQTVERSVSPELSNSPPKVHTSRSEPVISHKPAPPPPSSSSLTEASVHAARMFAEAPTSRVAIERMRHESQPEHVDNVESSADDEALSLACDELVNEWLQRRHTVLTEERKEFRVLSQQAKNLQKGQFMDMVQLTRNEALAQHAARRSTSTGATPTASSTELSPMRTSDRVSTTTTVMTSTVSPPRDNIKRSDNTSTQLQIDDTPQPSAPSPNAKPHASSSSAYTISQEIEASRVGLATPVVGTSPSRATSKVADNTTSARSDVRNNGVVFNEAMIRLAKIVDVTEAADRREISDAALTELHQIHEDDIVSRRRIQLRAEQALIVHERTLLADERRGREELMEVEVRKFAMFAGLCTKGVQRIKATATNLTNMTTPKSKQPNSTQWEEL